MRCIGFSRQCWPVESQVAVGSRSCVHRPCLRHPSPERDLPRRSNHWPCWSNLGWPKCGGLDRAEALCFSRCWLCHALPFVVEDFVPKFWSVVIPTILMDKYMIWYSGKIATLRLYVYHSCLIKRRQNKNTHTPTRLYTFAKSVPTWHPPHNWKYLTLQNPMVRCYKSFKAPICSPASMSHGSFRWRLSSPPCQTLPPRNVHHQIVEATAPLAWTGTDRKSVV